MEIIAHGIDLVDFGRIEEMISRHGERFLERIFTAAEQAYAESNKNSVECGKRSYFETGGHRLAW